MSTFINNAELAAYIGQGFGLVEIQKTTAGTITTTTIYSGKPWTQAGDVSSDKYTIRRTTIEENSSTGVTTIREVWAEGLWSNRASLTYQFL